MNYKEIAIIKLSSLGDIVHTLPAFKILRERFPDSKIYWFAEPAGAELLKNFAGIDKIVIVNLKKGSFFKKLKEVFRILSKYRKKFDLILDFQGLLKSSILSYLLKGERAGFHKRNLREPASGIFYTKKAPFYPEENHVILKNMNLLKTIEVIEDKIEYPHCKFEKNLLVDDFLKKNEISLNEYLIINVGGGWESKILSTIQYIKLAMMLSKKNKVIILWGNRDEEVRANEIVKSTGVYKTPFFDFPDLIYFIKKAKAVISSDSLPLHIADMTNTVSIGIFGPTSPYRNGSLKKGNLSIFKELDCSFCYKRNCSNRACINNLELEPISLFIEKL
ncbi:MAG: glycosyltransferase family 9 protein [Acidobacteriota bacterium]